MRVKQVLNASQSDFIKTRNGWVKLELHHQYCPYCGKDLTGYRFEFKVMHKILCEKGLYKEEFK